MISGAPAQATCRTKTRKSTVPRAVLYSMAAIFLASRAWTGNSAGTESGTRGEISHLSFESYLKVSAEDVTR
jgi:hypothetical protein